MTTAPVIRESAPWLPRLDGEAPEPAAATRSGGKNPIAFVFPGGGTLAAAQIGMLRALIEAGMCPDLVIGTSAGAFNAVAFASHPSLAGIARLAEVWTSMRRRQVLPVSRRRLYLAATDAQDGMLDKRALRQLIRETIGAHDSNRRSYPRTSSSPSCAAETPSLYLMATRRTPCSPAPPTPASCRRSN